MCAAINTTEAATMRSQLYICGCIAAKTQPLLLRGPTSWQRGLLYLWRTKQQQRSEGKLWLKKAYLGTNRTWWLQLLQLGLPSPTFIAVIGEELPRILGRDVRNHRATCSLLINRKFKCFFWNKFGFKPGTLDLQETSLTTTLQCHLLVKAIQLCIL